MRLDPVLISPGDVERALPGKRLRLLDRPCFGRPATFRVSDHPKLGTTRLLREKLPLPDTVENQLKRELRAAGRREIGGVLLGELVGPGVFRVAEITVQRTGYVLDVRSDPAPTRRGDPGLLPADGAPVRTVQLSGRVALPSVVPDAAQRKRSSGHGRDSLQSGHGRELRGPEHRENSGRIEFRDQFLRVRAGDAVR
jgi:hypothetical protein